MHFSFVSNYRNASCLRDLLNITRYPVVRRLASCEALRPRAAALDEDEPIIQIFSLKFVKSSRVTMFFSLSKNVLKKKNKFFVYFYPARRFFDALSWIIWSPAFDET